MRVAVFSNLWPPLFVGGYEIGAFEIVREMRKRGADVLVISAHEYHIATRDGALRSERHTRADRAEIVNAGPCLCVSTRTFIKRRGRKLLRDLMAARAAPRVCRDALRQFRPDNILAFNPQGILAPILGTLSAFGRATAVPVHCFVSDSWVAKWPLAHPLAAPLRFLQRSRSILSRLPAKVAGGLLRAAGLLPTSLSGIASYVHCSKFIRDLSRPHTGQDADNLVAHWGVADVQKGAVRSAHHLLTSKSLTLVYVGQILPHKGLSVLIRALARCRAKHSLVVIGDDQSAYATECKHLATSLGVLEQIRFLGKKPHQGIPLLLARIGDVAVMPSVWQEPFGLVVLEAMAAGLPVIAADTGGTAEAVTHGDNGLLFAGGDDRGLATLIDRLEADRTLCVQLAARARARLLQEFVIERMVDQLEAHLRPTLKITRRTAALAAASPLNATADVELLAA